MNRTIPHNNMILNFMTLLCTVVLFTNCYTTLGKLTSIHAVWAGFNVNAVLCQNCTVPPNQQKYSLNCACFRTLAQTHSFGARILPNCLTDRKNRFLPEEKSQKNCICLSLALHLREKQSNIQVPALCKILCTIQEKSITATFPLHFCRSM